MAEQMAILNVSSVMHYNLDQPEYKSINNDFKVDVKMFSNHICLLLLLFQLKKPITYINALSPFETSVSR